MKVNTGAAYSIISESTGEAAFPDETLHPSGLILMSYTDERITGGTPNVQVKHGNQAAKIKLVVVGKEGPSIIERNWLKYIRLEYL